MPRTDGRLGHRQGQPVAADERRRVVCGPAEPPVRRARSEPCRPPGATSGRCRGRGRTRASCLVLWGFVMAAVCASYVPRSVPRSVPSQKILWRVLPGQEVGTQILGLGDTFPALRSRVRGSPGPVAWPPARSNARRPRSPTARRPRCRAASEGGAGAGEGIEHRLARPGRQADGPGGQLHRHDRRVLAAGRCSRGDPPDVAAQRRPVAELIPPVLRSRPGASVATGLPRRR